MPRIYADEALLPDGWKKDVVVDIDDNGHIAAIAEGAAASDGEHVDVLLPAPGNVHSHAFQHAMAGLAETRSSAAQDNFWTWREQMYRLVDSLGPDDVEAITAYVQMLSLEAGFASIGEFHYLHHQRGGQAYDHLSEMSERVIAAALKTGIGLTHLPVLYMRAGTKQSEPMDQQRRFVCSIDHYLELHSGCQKALSGAPTDFKIGMAPHSLRAVTKDALSAVGAAAGNAPIHIHIAEQTGEVREIKDAYGDMPVAWLLSNADVASNWCLVHATHITDKEVDGIAKSGAVSGLCPITEANLGDGIFPAERFDNLGGIYGVGSDSNVVVSLRGELALLEYSQRLSHRKRTILTQPGQGNGRSLIERVASGGAAALGRNCGAIHVGKLADLIALDTADPAFESLSGDSIIDAWVFAGAGTVSDVWSAGRHMVREDRHVHRESIELRFRSTLRRLRRT